MKIAPVILLVAMQLTVSAQHIYPILDIKKDSVKVGELVPVSLSVYYPKALSLVFPDSTFNYSPFEYESRKFFTTRTDSALSFDSVVYYLTTYEIDSVQRLRLPVFILKGEDSTAIYSEKDSIILQFVAKGNEQNVTPNLEFKEVPTQFNYPYFLIALGILLVGAIVVSVFFGKTIKKLVRLYFLRQQNKKFVSRFFEKMGQLSSNKGGVSAEQLLHMWKEYMEKLEKLPYTKLTSKEIIKIHQDDELKSTLKDIDKNIYGAFKMENVFGHFEGLMQFAIKQYEHKVNDIKHGV